MRRTLGVLGVAWLFAACGKGDDGETDAPTDTPDGDGANVRIDGAEGASVDPDSAGVRMCTAGGAVVVAWTDARDGVPAVWVRRSPDGGASWPDEPVRFGVTGTEARAPDLACDGSTVLLAWEDLRDGDRVSPNVYVAASADGGATWGAAVRATDDALGVHAHLGPKLAVAGGRVHVAWYGDEFGTYDVSVATSTDGGASFGAPARLGSDAPGAAWSAHPVIVADGAGGVLVAWEDRRSGLVDVYVAGSADGGASFGGDRRVDDGEGDSYSPALLAGPDGSVQVAWHDQRDGSAFEVYLARTDGGVSFGAPERMSAGEPAGRFDAVLPRLGWADDHLLVVFSATEGQGERVELRRLVDGVPTGDPQRVDGAPDTARSRYPKLATEGADVVVAWEDDRDAADEGERDLYYAWSADGGATFGSGDLRIDSRPAGGPGPVDVAIAVADGRLLAAWADARGGTLDVWFQGVSLGDPVPAGE